MDARVPAVVAVVVATDPGAWFAETLSSLAGQDYDQLSVLVVVPSGAPDPSEAVARALPEALVRPVGASTFAAAVNEALAGAEGAAFHLLCHDDVVLERNAVRLMVEESFRSNAGIVSPKVTRWDDPKALLHVGQLADKGGAPVERAQDGEVDHGQHDAVRDVFVAPSGCTLVRTDLFVELGGLDAGISAVGEDLDLCWRAQVAGARVVVAPLARTRHLQATVGGRRARPADPGGRRPGAEALRRRHELRTVLTCYSLGHLVRVVPQLLAFSLLEAVLALAAGDASRARAVAGAWWWNLEHLVEIRRRRRLVQGLRVVPDRQLRHLQARGLTRLSAALTEAAQQGRELFGAGGADEMAAPELTGSVGGAFSEDASFDELEETTRVRRPPPLSTPRSRLALWVVVGLVLVVGSRQLLTGGFPVVGQLVPLASWSGTWHQFFASWHPAGVGTTAPATPAFAVLGMVATVLFGQMGLAHTVVVLGCLPVGAWGVVRLLRPVASARARAVAGVAYLGLPLAYDALARGRWDALVAFAAVPFVVSRVLRAAGALPEPPVPGWRGTLAGQAFFLGVLEAVAISFAPAVAVDLAIVALAAPLGTVLVAGDLTRARQAARRAWAVAALGTAVAAVLCAPWAIGVLWAGRSSVGVLGLPSNPASAPGWSALLRFDVGPVGGSALSWLLLAAALLPLLVARAGRLVLAAQLWCLALASFVLAFAVGQGWTGAFAPTPDVVLAPAACAVAASVGLGVAAFESDLVRFRFGWRQVASALAIAAAAVGLIPVVAEAGNGQWGLPATGLAQPLGWLPGAKAGGARVLWLADPAALPGGGWSIGPGLAYATTEGGLRSASPWAPAGPGPAAHLADAVTLAEEGRTTELGALLAPAGIRDVVVLQALAPSVPGVESASAFPTPPALMRGLLAQDDLRLVPGGEGFEVFVDTVALPLRAERSSALGGLPEWATWPAGRQLQGWHGVLAGAAGGQRYQGTVRGGPVVAAYAPGGRWQLEVDGRRAPRRPAYGWAAQFSAPSGRAELRFFGSPLVPAGLFVEVLVWVGAASVLLGRRRARRGAAPGPVASEVPPPTSRDHHEVGV